ncbi:hypothetical protein, partial [Mycolicibacterium smegmatis]
MRSQIRESPDSPGRFSFFNSGDSNFGFFNSGDTNTGFGNAG